ncbi:hypothetical protein EYF80_048516 [Liparis tanakae]|uniref:Uncharacterized protein n=1 Tax=Liparis tanakae TaxID=230148 RepID=A0A4Z2FKP9_9TELE|nr:hypothetical protein EYF80_048516 [Liparis tanakae]
MQTFAHVHPVHQKSLLPLVTALPDSGMPLVQSGLLASHDEDHSDAGRKLGARREVYGRKPGAQQEAVCMTGSTRQEDGYMAGSRTGRGSVSRTSLRRDDLSQGEVRPAHVLKWPRSTLTRTMQESATCRLYKGSEVMDTERLWWEAGVGFGEAAPQDVAGEQRSARQEEEAAAEEELKGESGEEAAEERGEEEEDEDEEEEKASDTLLQELWKHWRADGGGGKRRDIDERALERPSGVQTGAQRFTCSRMEQAAPGEDGSSISEPLEPDDETLIWSAGTFLELSLTVRRLEDGRVQRELEAEPELGFLRR